jgi:hypothetical protein
MLVCWDNIKLVSVSWPYIGGDTDTNFKKIPRISLRRFILTETINIINIYLEKI